MFSEKLPHRYAAPTVVSLQTRVGFLSGGRGKSFHQLPAQEQASQKEEAYARATVTLIRAQQICFIMGPLDMQGVVGAATIIGCLKYGASFSGLDEQEDSVFCTLLQWTCTGAGECGQGVEAARIFKLTGVQKSACILYRSRGNRIKRPTNFVMSLVTQWKDFKKCSENDSFVTFSLPNVRFATAGNFSTSKLQKVLPDPQFFSILTSECASRHSGVQFFDIRTSKSARE